MKILDQPQARRARRSGQTAPPLYDALDSAMIRAPLLPIDAYLRLAAGTRAPADRSLGPNDPRVRAAIAVGSRDLSKALSRTHLSGNSAGRVRRTLLRYLIRMSTRPTPYGLFAGVGLVDVRGTRTDVAIAARDLRAAARPDMAWLLGLVGALEAEPDIRRHLGLTANPFAVVRAGRVLLPERAPMAEEPGEASAVSVQATGAVRRALAAARTCLPYGTLVNELLSVPGATPDKAERLVDELCRHTLLLTDLRPPLTCPSPAQYVVDRLRGIPAARDRVDDLLEVLDDMRRWQQRPADQQAATYGDLAASLARLHPVGAAGDPIQVDAALELAGRHLSHEVAAEAARAAELLVRLSPLPRGLPHLAAYRQAFAGKYGTDRKVPLLELLDPNVGIGPPAHHGHVEQLDPEVRARRHQTLWNLAVDALREHRLVVELDEATIALLQTSTPTAATAPRSVDLSVLVAARSPQALDAGDFQLVVGPNLGASVAGRNLGRFADLLAPQAPAVLARAAAADVADAPHRLQAELVYLPRRARSANVAIRPATCDYEITVATTPGVSRDRVIPLNELVVGVRDDRFVVEWTAGNTEVVVRAGHMLNNSQAPAACRFLEDVAHEGLIQFSAFDWGAAAEFPVLPRVQAGRVVLAPAQWRIDDRTQTTELSPEPADEFPAVLQRWRMRWAVPRYIYLTVADNRLLLDLEDRAQAEELRREVAKLVKGGWLLVQEGLPGPEHGWLPGPDGGHIGELVVPLVLRDVQPKTPAAPVRQHRPAAPVGPRERLRPPGSDWLFVKLYGPRAVEENLIAGPMRGFCRFATSARLADDWFFLRYADPDPHLRLRFRGQPQQLLHELLPRVCEWTAGLIDDGWCTRWCLDTYEREIERYGGPAGTETAEAIYAADSVAVAELLALSQRTPAIDRTALALVSIDDLLAGLGLTEDARLDWYRRHTRTPRGGDEYRRRQATLRPLLGNPATLRDQPDGATIEHLLAARRAALDPIGRRLDELARHDQLLRPKTDLYESYVHLHCNRLLGTGPPYEDIVIELVRRTRESLHHFPS